MTKKPSIILLFLLPLSFVMGQMTTDFNFNLDWMFLKGDQQGAEKYDFNDSGWRDLDLPHDWSIEDLPVTGTSETRVISGPFDSESEGGKESGYTVGGIGWYRKHFHLPRSDTGKVIYLNFDGIYMNSTIWVNGIQVCTQPYGYSAFWIDINDMLYFGDKENILAVQVKNTTVSSRWYAGSGIYRDVLLRKVNKIHFEPRGIFVSTQEADEVVAEISVSLQLKNTTYMNQDVSIIAEIIDDQSNTVAEKIISTRLHDEIPGKTRIILKVDAPKLWSPDHPDLYRLRTSIIQNGELCDVRNTHFGIRTIEYDPDNGMFLNGENIKLKGGSVHSNNGSIGAAAFKEAEKRRVRILKEAGFNAVRCAHNPPSSAFLDECDRQGLLVIDEAFDDWIAGILEDDYKVYFNLWWEHDLKNMIFRDRNHPGIFTWSIGNQIRNARESTAIDFAHQLADYTRSIDPSRPVTANIAMFISGNWLDGSSEFWKDYDAIFESLDISGYSYQSGQYENVHERLPDRIQFSSEINPRHCFRNWMRVMDHDYVIGNFTWTAIDYMGEAASGWLGLNQQGSVFPWHSTYCGDIDCCGFRKPRSYYRNILFNSGKQISLFVHAPEATFEGENASLWGWDDVKPSWTWNGYHEVPLQVDVYSAFDSVSLYINKTLLGTKETSRDTEFRTSWEVPFQEGTLMAIGYGKNGISDTSYLKTTGEPFAIRLIPEKDKLNADRQDLCFIIVEVVDENGQVVPYSDDLINFNIRGEGRLLAVGNGNPTSLESYQQPYRKAYEGKCLLVIRSSDKEGEIEVKAESEGLKPGNISLVTVIGD